MKAKDLMTGNYLSYNGFEYRVIQVTAGFDGDDSDSWTLENGEENVGESIEITPEFLEKNGFEKWNDGWLYDGMLEYYEIFIDEMCDGIFRVWKRDLEFGIADATISLSFVHELQNFLTLNGIDLEIKV